MRGLHAVCRFCSLTVHGVQFHDCCLGEFDGAAQVVRFQDALDILNRMSGEGQHPGMESRGFERVCAAVGRLIVTAAEAAVLQSPT